MQRARWTTSILVILLASVVALLVARRDTASAAKQDPPRVESANAANTAPADVIPPVSAKPGVETAGAAERDTTPAATPDPSSLETIGALAAAHYFQTYLNIGLIADGKGSGLYSDENARKDLGSVLSVVDSVDRQLDSFGKHPMAKEDRQSLEQMRAISTLLRQQGKALQTYWDRGQEQDAAHYEGLRKDLYAAINKLMGISPK
jgi:hypothetical protein